MTDMAAVVYAGGQGTRLWPLSRDRRPKQFQPLSGDAPMLTVAIERLKEIVPAERIYISTLARFREAALDCRAGVPQDNLIFEREGKGPATAFALSLAQVHGRHGNVRVFTCPSDYMVDSDQTFLDAATDMLELLQDHPDRPVLLGVEPTRPDTALGYFKVREKPGAGEALEAYDFVEKPPVEVAQELIDAGAAMWNTACYALRPEVAMDVYRARRPFVMTAVERYLRSDPADGYGGPTAGGHELEPFFEAGVHPLLLVRELGWNDLGTWPRLESWLSTQGVDAIGPAVNCDDAEVFVVSLDGRPVVTMGAENLIVVTHHDAVYVIDKRHAADKDMLDHLRSALGGMLREDLL